MVDLLEMTHVNIMGVQRETHARGRNGRERGHDTCVRVDARAILSLDQPCVAARVKLSSSTGGCIGLQASVAYFLILSIGTRNVEIYNDSGCSLMGCCRYGENF